MTAQNLWLEGYRLCTAEIIFERPAKPAEFAKVIWRELDHAPDFPVLNSFLRAWQHQDGVRVHSVQVAASESIGMDDLRQASISVLVH
ncbi:MAG: Usg family protein [Alphaproteobacteria bacterium]|nr:MAG: Usg family protein [Alphaproteobacteria bacterium]